MLRIALALLILLAAPRSASAQTAGTAQGQPLSGPPPPMQPAHEAEIRREAERQIEGERARIDAEEWNAVKGRREAAWRQRGYVPPPSPFRLDSTTHAVVLQGGGIALASGGAIGTTLSGVLGLAPRWSLMADAHFASERLRGRAFLAAGTQLAVQATLISQSGFRATLSGGLRLDVPLDSPPYSYALSPELRYGTWGCVVPVGRACAGITLSTHVGVRIPIEGRDSVSRAVRPYFGFDLGPALLF